MNLKTCLKNLQCFFIYSTFRIPVFYPLLSDNIEMSTHKTIFRKTNSTNLIFKNFKESIALCHIL